MNDENIEDGNPEVTTNKTEATDSAPESTEPERGRIAPGDDAESDDDAAALGDAKLVSAIADFSDQIREINRISEERERIIDRLHQENQKLKQGEVQQVLLPVFRDLIRLYDDLKTTAAKYADPDGNEKISTELNCYGETVGDILYRHGVEKIEVAAGESFNPKEHKAVTTAPSADAERDRTISKIVRDGFKTDIRVVRNVEVEVYRYIPPANSIEGQAQPARETESAIQEAQ